MNGLGIGTLLGLCGVLILQWMEPEAELVQYVAAFIGWGYATGLVFELYRLALSPVRPSRR